MFETKLQSIEAHAALLLMEIHPKEAEADFAQCLSEAEHKHWDSILHPEKKMEFLAVRQALILLMQKLNLNYQGTYKDAFGKPYLINHQGSIALTHAYPYVAVQWRRDSFAGIDMEGIQPKLLKVAHRVLCPQELEATSDDLNMLAAFWCAKEALYKSYGKRNLIFKEDLLVSILEEQPSGFLLQGQILKNKYQQKLRLKYLNYNNFGFAYVQDALLDQP